MTYNNKVIFFSVMNNEKKLSAPPSILEKNIK